METAEAASALSRKATTAMDARAFATGGDVYFGHGETGPDLGLIAHELTHVVQQGAAARPPVPGGPRQRAGQTVRRPITIGDVLRAFRELGATDDHERRAIAQLLGYDLEGAAAGPVAPPPIAPPVVPPRPVAPPEMAQVIAPVDSDAPATELVRLPDIVTNPVDLPAPIARPEAAPPAALHTAPLLAAEWSPAILARLGARMARLGAIDLARLIPRVARRAPIRSVPRLLRLVTAPRIAVVLDVSGVMPWLADDQAQLVAQLRATLRAPIEVVTSDGPPVVAEPGAAGARGAEGAEGDDGDDTAADDAELDATTGDDGRRGPRVRVEHGTRVLAITDLGAGSSWMAAAPGRVLAWRAFARDLRAQGASLVVLTPVPAARRPRELGELRCLHWDRRTRPSQVHALVRQLR